MRTNSNIINVSVDPLNISSSIKIAKGNLIQTFSRDSGEYEPDRSIVPLVLMPIASVIDPNSVMPNGPQPITGVNWYIGTPEAGTEILSGMAGYEISASGEQTYSLKITKNVPVDGQLQIYCKFSFVDTRTNTAVFCTASVVVRTNYYDSENYSLKTDTPSLININPIHCQNNGNQWPVSINAQMYSGANALPDANVVYFWQMKENGNYRNINVDDRYVISGLGTKNIIFDAALFGSLSVRVRSAYYGQGENIPTNPSDNSLSKDISILVRITDKISAHVIQTQGMSIKPNSNTTVGYKLELSDSIGIIANPTKYFNITWYFLSAANGSAEQIIGYGESISINSGTLINNTTGGQIYADYELKVGSTWNLEGSVYSGTSNTVPIYQFGSLQIANRLAAYIVKHNADDSITIVGKFKKNNWFRFDDGSLAPSTVASEAADLGYDIVYGWNETIHTIENAQVGSEQIALFSEKPFTVKGVASREIKPCGVCPGLPTLYQSKLRFIYFGFNNGTSGSKGKANLIDFTRSDRSYPAVNQSQFSVNTAAMAKNTNTAATVPFAPLMDWNLLNITNALMNKFGTVDLHAQNLFGGGISSNEAVSASNWGKVTGVRYKIGSATDWTYAKLGDTPAGICYNTSGGTTNWSDWISQQYPRMRTAEIQMALSYAVENNIAPDTNFTFDGETYYYENIDGFTSLLGGEMNARLYKKYTATLSAYNTSGTAISVNLEVLLQSSCVYGIDLVSADVFQYAGAGIERIANITDATSGSNANNSCDVYLCTEQDYLDKSTDVTKNNGDKFAFETSTHYNKIGTTKQVGNYYTYPFRGTRIGSVQGGSLHTNAMFNDLSNYSSGTVGQRVRMGHRSRGAGSWPFCSGRFLFACSPLSSANAYCGGGFQVRLSGR